MKIIQKLIGIFFSIEPHLRKNLLLLLLFLFVFNVSVWVYCFFVSKSFPILFGLVTLAYGLGLRHAVDADHIAAIDNTTRKLMQSGKRPVGVGFFFSLGHATVVVLLSFFVAFSAAFIKDILPTLQKTGEIIGLSVSSFFLTSIGLINLVAFIEIVRTWKQVVNKKISIDITLEEHFYKGGIMAKIFKPFLKAVEKSWHMFIVGFLFGLGFDTASEVGLLSISAATGASGLPISTILLLPFAFTAGMCLIDSLDGILMLGTYGWAYVKPIRKLYYNMNITLISVIIALFIGCIEALQVITSLLHLQGGFFAFIAGVNFSNLGYIIVAIFIGSFLISILVYQLKKFDAINHKPSAKIKT